VTARRRRDGAMLTPPAPTGGRGRCECGGNAGSASCRGSAWPHLCQRGRGRRTSPKLANKIFAPPGTVLFISPWRPGISSAPREIRGLVQHRPHHTLTAARSPLGLHKPSEKPVTSLSGSQLTGKGGKEFQVRESHSSGCGSEALDGRQIRIQVWVSVWAPEFGNMSCCGF